LSQLKSEKAFLVTLNPEFINLARREFLRKSMAILVGGMIGLALTPFILKLMQSMLPELDKDYRDFVNHYRNLIHGEHVIKRFEAPYFKDLHITTGVAAELTVPVKEFYHMYKQQRPEPWAQRYQLLAKPSPYLTAFLHKIHDLQKQESMMWGEGLGKAFDDRRYIAICSVLALISKYVEYVSDYKQDIDSTGAVVAGTNRDKHKILYDKRDYWKYPEQTLIDGYGDCEDFSILAIAQLHALKTVKAGLALLQRKKSAHAILAIESDISFIEKFITHQIAFLKKPVAPYPHIYVANHVQLPKYYKKACMACPWKNNDDFIILFEPQDYHANATAINLESYPEKSVCFNGQWLALHKNFQRVMKVEMTESELKSMLPDWTVKMDRCPKGVKIVNRAHS